MNPFEPRPRRRGYFLDPESPEGEVGEAESAEGFTVRVRIVRPVRKQAVLAARSAATPHPRTRRYGGRPRKPESPVPSDRS